MRADARRSSPIRAILVAVALVASGCGSSDEFERREVAEVQAALERAGLEICSSREGELLPPDAESERLLVVAEDCAARDDVRANVQITAWDDEDARDSAAARHESHARPTSLGYGAVWTLGDLTIDLSGPRADAVSDRVGEAMESLGAGD